MLYKLYDFTNHYFHGDDFLNEENILKEIEKISSNIIIQIHQIHEFDDNNLINFVNQSPLMYSDFAKTILCHFKFIGILLSDTIHNSIQEFDHAFVVMLNIHKLDTEFYTFYPNYSDTVKETSLFFEIDPKIVNFLRTKTNIIHKNFCFFETNDAEKIIINKLIKDKSNNFDYHILDKKTLCWL